MTSKLGGLKLGFFAKYRRDHWNPKPPGSKIHLRKLPNKKKLKVIPADDRVILLFNDIQHAYHLRHDPNATADMAHGLERQAWERLMRWLVRLPPLSDDT